MEQASTIIRERYDVQHYSHRTTLRHGRMRIAAGLLAASAACMAGETVAAPRLGGVFASRAVIQRDQPIAVDGEAAAGERVMITLAGRSTVVTAGRDGRFSAQLPALPAGGPYDMTVAAASGATVLRDVLIGDVFLCSGQSNMEMTVASAQNLFGDAHAPTDDTLRLLTIPRLSTPAPQAHLPEPANWVVAGPDTQSSFSAVCFYMAQALRRTAKVPIGAIVSSWGGSRISAWMSDAALRRADMTVQADLVALYARDPAAANVGLIRLWEEWWRSASGDVAGREPWQPTAALDWRAVPDLTPFESWGVPELARYNGMVWYRREVELTAAQARGRATLALGRIDDEDRAWLNGRAIGGGGAASQTRLYELPAGTLKPGRNVITLNAEDYGGPGGMTGPADTMRIVFADGTSMPLGSDWRYAVARRTPDTAPRAPWGDIRGSSTLHNGMIAPLGRTRVAGIAWYQGESDVSIPGYTKRLAAMVADWRQRLASPQAAVGVVQLANYGNPPVAPSESGWGYVRDAQRRFVEGDGRAGLAVALDIGDALDLHPGEKRVVGLRLAQVMRATVYGERVPASGPAIAEARRDGGNGGVTLRFAGVTGALRPRGSNRAIGFELCDAAPATCRYADATIAGETVTLAGDGKPVTRVRYAWADAPVTNLLDEAVLPVGGFEVPVP